MKRTTIIGLMLLISTYAPGSEHQLTNNASIGPEGYWVERSKAGGTKQSGAMWGVRATYERLKRYGWYLGADILWATGTLNGRSGAENSKIRSNLTDTNF